MISKKISFIPTSKAAKLLIKPPSPAKFYIPEWLKDLPGINSKNVKLDINGKPNTNVKNCVPLLDGFISGYIQETWTDIYVEEDKEGDITYNQASKTAPEIMSHREKSSFPESEEYYKFEFVWHEFWIPKLPDGYSYLFIHPINRFDLPFTTTSAVVDGDKLNYTHGGNVPFYIKKGFSGLIPSGTPMYQIIPFKRESWKNSVEEYNEDLSTQGIHDLRKNYIGSYKKRYWTRKEYN
jgi:hypothetical protein